jgi:hypothetical protein
MLDLELRHAVLVGLDGRVRKTPRRTEPARRTLELARTRRLVPTPLILRRCLEALVLLDQVWFRR